MHEEPVLSALSLVLAGTVVSIEPSNNVAANTASQAGHKDTTCPDDIVARHNEFKTMVSTYTEGDLFDDNDERRAYSSSLPHGSTPTEKLLWGAFIAQVEEADDQLLEYIRFRQEDQRKIRTLTDQKKNDEEAIEILKHQRFHDQQHIACLEQQIADLMARLATPSLSVTKPSAISSVSIKPDDGNVIVISQTTVEALREVLGVNSGKP
ncbi:hypothetical protein B0T21DRAFT_353252 [Apiosordaria backusii]|uniref:Uncharacterized protein n=1 Tax=Apiosordaria backusii TaxID=314023 RepID=A0AA39ZV55_9PEZI|nr:hypothetical protein B0T21DRAFT_353252 [Apiosordaria backusii]